jgi:hypothetical protein
MAYIRLKRGRIHVCGNYVPDADAGGRWSQASRKVLAKSAAVI